MRFPKSSRMYNRSKCAIVVHVVQPGVPLNMNKRRGGEIEVIRPENKGRDGRNDLPRMYPFGSGSYVPSSRGRIQRRRMMMMMILVYLRSHQYNQTRVISPRAPKHMIERRYTYQKFCHLKESRNTLSRGKNFWHVYRLFGIDQSKAHPGRNRAKSNKTKNKFKSPVESGRNRVCIGQLKGATGPKSLSGWTILFRCWLFWWMCATNSLDPASVFLLDLFYFFSVFGNVFSVPG